MSKYVIKVQESDPAERQTVWFTHLYDIASEEDKQGIVKEIPAMMEPVVGKGQLLYYNATSGALFWEYVDMPKTAEEELADVKAENAVLKEQAVQFQQQLIQTNTDMSSFIDFVIQSLGV